MLFITNRGLKQSKRSRAGRKVDFDLNNTEAEQSLYFCRRNGEGDYVEVTSGPFMQALRECNAEQIVLFLHGFSNLPEDAIFPRVAELQELLDDRRPNLAQVVPLIWPCDNDFGIVKDYWDDQRAADASAFAFSRAFAKFMDWREKGENADVPCLKRINILAHSMGNRVLRQSLRCSAKYDYPRGLPLIFRNAFMVAADVVNECLERGESAENVAISSRNVAVYFANDDLALRSSKAANLKNKIASRRLGHSGPEDMRKVPGNVYAVDCDNYNMKYDRGKGHSYFLRSNDGGPGEVFQHIAECIESGRVPVGENFKERVLVL